MTQIGPDGKPIRLRRTVERLSEYAEMVQLGYSIERIMFELGVSRRTVERYRARLQSGESPEMIDVEWRYWRPDAILTRKQRNRTRALRAALDAGHLVVGPDNVPVMLAPRSTYDSMPWLAESTGARYSGTKCRSIDPDREVD